MVEPETIILTSEEKIILAAWRDTWLDNGQPLPLGVTYHQAIDLVKKLNITGAPAIKWDGWLLECTAKTEPEWTPERIRARVKEVHEEWKQRAQDQSLAQKIEDLELAIAFLFVSPDDVKDAEFADGETISEKVCRFFDSLDENKPEVVELVNRMSESIGQAFINVIERGVVAQSKQDFFPAFHFGPEDFEDEDDTL